jgi:hypothetical protein
MKREKIAKPKPKRKSVKQIMRDNLYMLNWHVDTPEQPLTDGWCVPTEEDFQTLTNF